MQRSDGTIQHAEVKIGDSVVMMGEPQGQLGPRSAMLYVYVDDVDSTYRRAIQSGASSLSEPADMFYGDRTAGIQDASGNTWWIAKHIEDVAPEELQRRAAAAGRG